MIEQWNGEIITEETLERRLWTNRGIFHLKVFELLGITKDMDRIVEVSKLISNYIDKPENEMVRRLISESVGREDDKLEQAAHMVIQELKLDDHLSQAA
jgi:hypothetical protein